MIPYGTNPDKRYNLTILLCYLIITFFSYPVSANAPLTVGSTFKNEKGYPMGSILSVDTDGAYRLSISPYDSRLVGVLVYSADLLVIDQEASDSYLVSRGIAQVLVTGENGSIAPGDYITSSSKPGYGMKSNIDGIVIGVAQERSDVSTASSEDAIEIVVDPRYVTIGDTMSEESMDIGFFNRIAKSLKSPFIISDKKLSITPAFRYVLAILLVVITVIGAFMLYSRLIASSIDSLGRNPLAKRSILLGIVLNTFIILSLVLFGLGIAYLTLVL